MLLTISDITTGYGPTIVNRGVSLTLASTGNCYGSRSEWCGQVDTVAHTRRSGETPQWLGHFRRC